MISMGLSKKPAGEIVTKDTLPDTEVYFCSAYNSLWYKGMITDDAVMGGYVCFHIIDSIYPFYERETVRKATRKFSNLVIVLTRNDIEYYSNESLQDRTP